jgi:hypothetical protein
MRVLFTVLYAPAEFFFYKQLEKLLGTKHFTMGSICTSASIAPIVHLLSDALYHVLLTFAIAAVIRALSSSSVFALWIYTWSFLWPQRKTSKGVKSGQRGGYAIGPHFPIHYFQRVTNYVRKINRCTVKLNKIVVVVVVKLRKSIIFRHV